MTITDAPAIGTLAKTTAAETVARHRDALVGLSHAIHADPELSWQEHNAANRVAEMLRENGFDVTVGAYGVPTAVEAICGEGDLTVAICAEYDALPGVGHACGHNVIAAAGVGAALALAPLAREAGLRIKLLGTPAEEHGGGKVAMLTAGAWEDVDFSLMVHGTTGVDRSASAFRSTAVDRFEVEFTGRTAHAAGAPMAGINAGSAATLALTAIALLRQHLSTESNLNAIVSDGGEATNIIPGRTVVQVEVRAYELDVWRDMKQRVLKCFEGAAIATGCAWEARPTEHPYAPMRHELPLAELWDANLTAIGRVANTDDVLGGGSTDMGNVSQVLPAIHPMIAFLGEENVPHNPAFAASAATPAADQAVIDGATLLAWTVLDVATDPVRRAEYLARTAARPVGATRTTIQA
ncbi:amidohydrolase [Microbacteriaceae bacterium VKM Ac-2854]|nr:amidohydrolase [Microbacteriaceae bacterium VKM Ac-2854]